MSLSKVNIEEANRHLQALHERAQELELIIKEQAEALIRKDELMQVRIAEIVSAKEAEVAQYQQALHISEQKVQNLMMLSRNKDARINQLKQRCEHLDELIKAKPVLENVLDIMKRAECQHMNGTPPQLHQEFSVTVGGAASNPSKDDVTNSPQSVEPNNFSIGGGDSDAAGSGDDFKKTKRTKELYL